MNLRSCFVWAMFPMCAASCEGPRPSEEPLEPATEGEGGSDSTPLDADDGDAPRLDAGTAIPGCGNVDIGCTDQIDLLFVIDNSGTMAEEQENLARNFPRLVERLENLVDANGNAINPDVQIMITTTDFGNPLCTPHQAEGYIPAAGAPITSVCLNRLERFTGLGSPPSSVPEACENVCLNVDAAPMWAPYIAFTGSTDNIPDTVTPVDINGDGELDSAVAQALACVGPQGIDGCGYEAPLETMLHALDENAEWNVGDKPFLRPGALLAIAIITDEVDCSVMDYSVMSDEAFFETEPSTGEALPSSALCWNAGVDCEPNGDGTYACEAVDKGKLHPTARYTDYLVDYLRGTLKKEVVMLGVLGVPPVTERNPDPPYEPLAGGVKDLVYRDWKPGTYPDGDLLPGEANDADYLQFEFGIGPGCTVVDEETGFAGQGIPPVRIQKVCESLNEVDDEGEVKVRCCIESICGDDFSAAIDCLANTISENIVVPTG